MFRISMFAVLLRFLFGAFLFVVVTFRSPNSSGHVSGIGDGGCHFPRSWWGTWYQSGLGDITITTSQISNKGHCIEKQRDYYLLENRRDACHQCLLVISRHPNIIQYKESYCIGPETMHSLCGKIRVEAVLYTLVREISTPTQCPFQNAFHFIYNNNSGGFCRHPVSYAHQCASDAKIHFRFRRCEQFAYTSDRDMHMECLASWKDGSDMYLYAQFLTEGGHSKENRYRCFMYSILGTVVYLSISADATCRGLRTSKDGPMTMELTEDSHGWPTSECDFPLWLTEGSSWSDLKWKHHYAVREGGPPDSSMVLEYYRKASGSSHVLVNYKCIRREYSNVTTEGHDGLLILAHVLDDCESRYQCLRLVRRHFYVVQLQKGDYMIESNRRCINSDFFQSHSNQLLVSENLKGGSCPFEGKYSSVADDVGCRTEVSAGCLAKSRLTITSTCQTHPVLQLSCLLWWKEGPSLFFLVQAYPADESGRILCYLLRPVGSDVDIIHDRSCTRDLQNTSHGQSESYRFKNYLDECPLEALNSEVSPGHNVIDPDEYLPENGYRYVIGDKLPNLDSLPVQTSGYVSGQSSSSGQTSTGFNRFSFNDVVVRVSLLFFQRMGCDLLR